MAKILMIGDVWLRAPILDMLHISEPYIVNLEAPVGAPGKPHPGKVNLRSDRLPFGPSFGRNPVAVSLANNHCINFGTIGLTSTMDALRAEQIPFFGAGTQSDNANNPIVIEVGGYRLGLCGYVCSSTHPVFLTAESPGVRAIDPGQVALDVAEARRRGADRVAVFLHWGVEEVNLPRRADRELAEAIVAGGPDLVVGGHAHVTQGWERIGGVQVLYGLGNFAFSDINDPGFYDGVGATFEQVQKRWSRWNRESLGVRYDLETGSNEIVGFVECGERILARTRRRWWERELTRPSPGYDRQFDRGHAYGIIRSKVGAYLRSPKLPRWRHIRSLWRIAGEARVRDRLV